VATLALAVGSEEVTKVACSPGTYNSQFNAATQADCLQCPPGKYCKGGEQSFTGLCDKGYICTGGQSTPTPTNTFTKDDYSPSRSGPCPVGNYCPTGSSFPIPCPVGTYQDLTG